MEWLDWAIVWGLVKTAARVLVALWGFAGTLIILFFAVSVWRLIPRLDSLIRVERVIQRREEAAKAKLQTTEPLPPRTYAENMADHERATKRLSEGVEP